MCEVITSDSYKNRVLHQIGIRTIDLVILLFCSIDDLLLFFLNLKQVLCIKLQLLLFMSSEFYYATFVDKLIADYFAKEKRSFETLKDLMENVNEITKDRKDQEGILFNALYGLEHLDPAISLHKDICERQLESFRKTYVKYRECVRKLEKTHMTVCSEYNGQRDLYNHNKDNCICF